MKVAVCLVGIVGGHTGKHGEGDPQKVLEIGYKHYKQFILDNNDGDSTDKIFGMGVVDKK